MCEYHAVTIQRAFADGDVYDSLKIGAARNRLSRNACSTTRRTINPPDNPSGTSTRRWPTSSAHELRGSDHVWICQTCANSVSAFIGLGMDDVCGIDGIADAFHHHSCEHRRVLSVHANSLADGLNGDACFGTWSVC